MGARKIKSNVLDQNPWKILQRNKVFSEVYKIFDVIDRIIRFMFNTYIVPINNHDNTALDVMGETDVTFGFSGQKNEEISHTHQLVFQNYFSVRQS